MSLSDSYVDFLHRYGMSMRESHGVNDVALSQSDTLIAIGLIAKAGHVILGGDALLRRGDRLEFALKNWFAEMRTGESEAE